MRKLAIIIGLLAFATAGCQHQYWTFVPGDDAETVDVSARPEPDSTNEPAKPVVTEPVEPEKPKEPAATPKDVIFVLGVDGMD